MSRRNNRGRYRRNRGHYGWDQDFDYLDVSSDSDSDLDLLDHLYMCREIGISMKKSNVNRLNGCTRKDGVYYNEDHIPINTIYVSFNKMVKPPIYEAQVKDKFMQYGPIKQVRIHSNTNVNNVPSQDAIPVGGASGVGSSSSRNRPKFNGQKNSIPENPTRYYAFVSFENCADAARCLKNGESMRDCRIEPADSWHQDEYIKKQQLATGKEPTSGTEFKAKNPSRSDGSKKSTEASGSGKAVASSSKCTLETVNENPAELVTTARQQSSSEVSGLDKEVCEAGTNILQLDDDCLMLIFGRLEIMDLIAVKKTCARFELIVSRLFKRFKVFNFDRHVLEKASLTILDVRTILADIGPFVEEVEVSKYRFVQPSPRILSIITRGCDNLTALKIRDFTLTGKTLKGLEPAFRKLQCLGLIDCNITDTVAASLAKATLLKELDLSSNSEITGLCLRHLKGLTHLNLENCQNIQGKPFAAFAQQNETMRYLNIASCCRLTTEAIRSITQHMTALEHLVCNNDYKYIHDGCLKMLASLPKLKKLKLKINNLIPINELLEALAEKNQLEHLEIADGLYTSVEYNVLCGLTHLSVLKLNHKRDLTDANLAKLGSLGNFHELHIAGCVKITEEQLIEFIKANPHLRVLDISWSSSITEELLFSAIDILKDQARKGSNRRLKVMVAWTNIKPVILNNALIKSHRGLLEISFEKTDNFSSDIYFDDMYDDVMEDDDMEFMGYDYDYDDSDYGQEYDSEIDMYRFFECDSDDAASLYRGVFFF